MASMFAIISKAVFEADAKSAAIGDVLPMTSYASKNKALDPLADGGSLFLVTVRPPDERLWLVAILERPKFAKHRWTAAANTIAITDVTPLIDRIEFETGSGIKAKPGALGMALQAPRRLTAEDVEVLRGAAGISNAPASTKRPHVSRTRSSTTTSSVPAESAAATAGVAKPATATSAAAKPDAAKPAAVKSAAVKPAATKPAVAKSAAAKPAATQSATNPAVAKSAAAKPAATKSAAAKPAAAKSAAAKSSAANLSAKAGAVQAGGATLEDVAAQLEVGQLLAALESVLAVWRATPAVELAELVEAIGAQVDRSMSPLAGEDHDVHGEWLAVASQRRTADVGRLMARLADGTLAMLTKRFQMLATFAPDPRIAIAPLELIATYTSYGAEPAYTAALALATKMGDGRAANVIGTLVSRAPGFKIGGDQGAKRVRKAEKAKAALAAPPEVAKADIAALRTAQKAAFALGRATPVSEAELLAAAPAAPAGSTRRDELLAAVFAAPDDDAPREVFADWLLEQSDPRGEFITLQLRGGDDKRVRELSKQHVADWIRPLDTVLRPDTIRFARGFLDSCVVDDMTVEQKRDLVGHPLWATVREIDCADADLLVHPVMRAMRRATFDGAGLSRLAASTHEVPLEALLGRFRIAHGVRMWTGYSLRDEDGDAKTAWRGALDVGALTHLTTLYLSPAYNTRNEYDWLFASKLARQIETIDLSSLGWGLTVKTWLAKAEALPKLNRLIVRQTQNNPNMSGNGQLAVVMLERAKQKWRATVQINSTDDIPLASKLRATIAGLPNSDFDHARLEYVGSDRYDANQMAKFATVVEVAFGSVEVATERCTPIPA